ncbi:glutathione S- transferase, nitrogen catabolite repression regulator [Tulasnella sp. 408]|nr:glutathione S- transferase, nitrogen catabolite repression regulator [Tulasnella sp. 408]
MAHEGLKPIRLYGTATPNGYKVSIFLEELKAVYPDFKYEVRSVSFRNNEQKEQWYLGINPNGRLPAITDPNRGDFNVFETAAIILYLAQHYDPEHELSRTYGLSRYQGEVLRLYNVLESRLSTGREYLAGSGPGKYSLADINGFPWVRSYAMAGIENFEKDFPNVKVSKFVPHSGKLAGDREEECLLQAWLDRLDARPPVQAGLGVPARDNADCADAPFAS